MLVDLLEDALVVHGGGVVVPQQGVLSALLGVVAYFCQIHAERQLCGEKKGGTGELTRTIMNGN